MKSRPNLLILHAHDMGRYNAAYGYDLPTPHMRQLADEGTIFRNAHCAAPTCSPSRGAMLTGRTAHQSGLLGLAHRGWELSDPTAHLAHWLGAHGYHTVLAGIQHEWPGDSKGPYREKIPMEHRSLQEQDIRTALDVAHWLRQPAAKEKPFFLWTGFFYPHEPYLSADPDRFPEGRMQPPPVLPDREETRRDWADYSATVERTDASIGLILDALRETGQAEETIVVLTTDHGVALPGMKCNLTGHGTGVTLVLRVPGEKASAGQSTDALVSHLDLFPTLCDLLNVDQPDGLLGTSLRPLLGGSEESVREDLFAEVSYHAAYQPMRSVRTSRWNYIRSFDPDRRPPLANLDNSRSKHMLLAEGFAERPTPEEALYDVLYDPQESRNVADDPAYASVRKEMRARLERWMTETDDPLLKGPIPAPPGAVVNTRESITPADGPFEQT